jgi:hypothetical protein
VSSSIPFSQVPRRFFGGIGAAESIGTPVCNSCDTNASR